jgi:HlyD family secretion protein
MNLLATELPPRRRWIAAATGVAALAIATAVYLLRPAPASDVIEANGQVRGTEVTLSARIPGIAEVVAVREGERVEPGQLVAQIAARELEARLSQAQGRAAAALSLLNELEAQARVLDQTIEQASKGARVVAGTTTHEVHRANEAVARADAEVAADEAQATQDRMAAERFQKLAGEGFVSSNYYDEVVARQRASEARLAATRQAAAEARAGGEKAGAASGEADIRAQDVPRLAAERERVIAARSTAQAQA